jgi:hypothetical protein
MEELPDPISLTVKGHRLQFFFFCDVNGNKQAKIAGLQQYFNLMPTEHLEVISKTLIIIVRRLNGGRCTGGGFYTSLGDWIGRERRTGVPDVFFAFRRTNGIIAITQVAFNDEVVRPFTFIHECAHAIHHQYPIYPRGARLSDFQGVRYARRNSVEEFAAETYARYLLRPNRICRDSGSTRRESLRARDARVTEVLLSSPAGHHLRAMQSAATELPEVHEDQDGSAKQGRLPRGGMPLITDW